MTKLINSATREKLRQSHLGKKLSPETRAKIGARHRGKPLSPEWRAKLSRAHKGKKHSPEHIEKVAQANRGLKRSAETRLKLHLSHVGRTYEEIFGPEKAQEKIEKMRRALTGRFSSFKGKSYEELYGPKKAGEMKAKLHAAQARYLSGPIRWTKRTYIEIKMEGILTSISDLQFESQKWVGKRYVADFLIPTKNLIIECDGEMWHNYPHGTLRDHFRDQYLKNCGYTILRFWERDINKQPQKIKTMITQAIN